MMVPKTWNFFGSNFLDRGKIFGKMKDEIVEDEIGKMKDENQICFPFFRKTIVTTPGKKLGIARRCLVNVQLLYIKENYVSDSNQTARQVSAKGRVDGRHFTR